MLTVSGKTLGQRKALFADWSMPLPLTITQGDAPCTLRELIGMIVRTEVAAFHDRQKEQQTIRALTAVQIAEGAKKGKVDSGGRDYDPQSADPDTAVAAALQAFEDGLFLVVLDDEERKSLDEEFRVRPDSRITFIRLSLLAGG